MIRGSAGGQARAKRLSGQRRREIAREAAKARWSQTDKATKIKRRYIPVKVKLQAALIALGLHLDTVEWHHDPPLEMRLRKGKDTIPPQLDPRYLFPRTKESHRLTTHAPDGDLAMIRKAKRIAKKQAGHRAAVRAKR